MVERAATPWWLDEGEEQCPFCLAGYAYELEVRCVDCDRPSCPRCAVVAREVRVVASCPECARGEC
jgi:hypothetical protein